MAEIMGIPIKIKEGIERLQITGSISQLFVNKELIFQFSGGGGKVPSDGSAPSTIPKIFETKVTKKVSTVNGVKKTKVTFQDFDITFFYETEDDIAHANKGDYYIKIKLKGNYREINKLKKK
jgi:hypothetical protein